MRPPMLYDALEEAEGSGVVLTVVYSGGSAPGHKRRILVRRIDGEAIQVTELPGRVPRTYQAHRIQLVADDDPAPWMPDRTAAQAIDPETFFAHWAYAVRSPLWPALGVVQRRVIDQAKTQPARAKAMAEGMEKTEATRRIKFMKFEHALADPPAYDFHEGDIFYRPDGAWLQVMGIQSGEFEPTIEIHEPAGGQWRRAYHLRPNDVARWLFSGTAPPYATRIIPAASLSATHRFSILHPRALEPHMPRNPEQYAIAKRLAEAEAGLAYLLDVFGDTLAEREGYRTVDGLDAVRYFLMCKHHWLPAQVKGLSLEDLRFAMTEEMAGWTAPDAARA